MDFDKAILVIIDSLIYIGMDSSMLNAENFDEPLTGSKLNLSAVQLMYLYMELQKKLNYTFDSQEVIQNGFNTISKIAYLLCEQNNHERRESYEKINCT